MVPLTVGHRDQPTNIEERHIRLLLKQSNFKLICDGPSSNMGNLKSYRSRNEEEPRPLKSFDSI